RLAASGPQVPVDGFRSDAEVIFGYRYESSAVVDDRIRSAEPWVSTLDGTPGTRAPHEGILDGERTASTLDQFGRCFVLVTGDAGQAWQDAARTAALHTGVPLAVHVGGADRYGVAPTGAALVRPDAFVAWRVWRRPRDPAKALVAVLSRMLHR